MSEQETRIHVVINPVAGKNEPIINTINDVFNQYGIDWGISVTRKFGDATEFARQAAEDGFDVVAGYGGDGTQHEIANGIIGTGALMGVLPGGTGNGFANELGTPTKLRPALELLCTNHKVRHVDVVQMNEGYFIQRLYVGIEPEEQTSRESKDKYGTFAYAIDSFHRAQHRKEARYKVIIDGEQYDEMAMKLYVVNAAKAGTGISITGNISKIDDGLVDVFILDGENLKSLSGAVDRMLHLDTKNARDWMRQGKEVFIDTDPDQPVWTDGEYTGRTPVSLKVLPAALPVIVPD
ncbi:MAG: diacylglycerol kinase family lipid kinase [Anaerolineaceae bacterium]|nr:MAG: diacylglycerol kinase family lipid kinase [Anaerolineaceae bacterium]